MNRNFKFPKVSEDENIENHQYARDVSGSLLRPDAKRRS
jgi:hypothetical protein